LSNIYSKVQVFDHLKSQKNKNKRTEKVRYISMELQACKFKTNGSIEGRIDVTVIVKSCKPASSKQMGQQREELMSLL
jgi:hypothetical protein